MALLQVRDCPEDIYKKISHDAKKQNRTIAQQVIVVLERGLGQEQPNSERRRELLARIEGRTITERANAIDDVKIIREDRDR
jgi:maltooligosyltrehalose synthase